ncbi:MAG TPA: hypothetical protein PLV70_07845 [Flavobacteriales bacterium]|mgnify:CR=1 FL=1|nr:hypothetical protein [Flavobacteriales bacterium]HRN36433.1 hypothetical protein [Flavobacteriales bacterium]HRO38818.1 hypothetical protein [Flavobacteriales bacterium]HRP82470.1 hypothetical protein [Flavobacteriales bacterium]HRQ85004.1 hypothetical protein [Flavobacteriales bacterium]
MNAKDEKKKPGKEQVPDDKPGPEAEGHENDKVIILPEHLPEHKHRRFRRAQDTVGMKTPGQRHKGGMSEAAERKARREDTEPHSEA